MRYIITFLIIIVVNSEELPTYVPIEGDVLVQSFPISDLTNAIEKCTESEYSHCGIVVKEETWYVLEAIGPVKETEIEKWEKHGRGGKYIALRFKEKYKEKIPAIIKAGKTFLGKPYDIHMSMDDEKIYCSELIYKAFKLACNEEIGKVVKLGDMKWKSSESFIRKLENGNLPLERQIISPRALVESDKMEIVYNSYKK